MKTREKICEQLFELSKKPYRFLFKQKKNSWKLSSTDLIQCPPKSLGHELGLFLKKNDFELIDKLESHDAYHVICKMNTTVRDEVGMQFLLLGNGKRSLYLYSTIAICFLLLPEYFSYFRSCYRKGKQLYPIHELKLLNILHKPLKNIQGELMKPVSKKHFNLINF